MTFSTYKLYPNYMHFTLYLSNVCNVWEKTMRNFKKTNGTISAQRTYSSSENITNENFKISKCSVTMKLMWTCTDCVIIMLLNPITWVPSTKGTYLPLVENLKWVTWSKSTFVCTYEGSFAWRVFLFQTRIVLSSLHVASPLLCSNITQHEIINN